jgi:plastocyanin
MNGKRTAQQNKTMKTRNLNFSIALSIALTVAVCLSSRQTANAGSPPLDSAGAGATVKGTVRLVGTLPKLKPINMAADPSCAKQHATAVPAQEIITDAKGNLQNAIVFVSEGLGDRKFDPPAQPVVIDQRGCMFQPHVLALRANQPLEMINSDSTAHNIHPVPANNREWNKAELPGSKMAETFPREEVAIPVRCNIHPWMRGYVAVFKHPFFVVTGKDGSFNLSNLPPGTYTIEVWHEKFGTTTQKITVGANDTKNLDFVFKSM